MALHIHCEDLTHEYGSQRVLDGLSLDVRVDHALAIIGPSGGGKSTLLRTLAGLLVPQHGEIRVNGLPVPKVESELESYRRRIGTVFQAFNLFPHLTALENVVLPLEKVHRVSQAREKAMAGLERLGLAQHAHKTPAELSGGQSQRVAIARALVIEPDFLLMDEPTSALDPEMTAEVLDVVAGLRDEGRPIVLVTHQMGFARQIADAVVFVAASRVVEKNSAEDFFKNPQTAESQRFINKILRY